MKSTPVDLIGARKEEAEFVESTERPECCNFCKRSVGKKYTTSKWCLLLKFTIFPKYLNSKCKYFK